MTCKKILLDFLNIIIRSCDQNFILRNNQDKDVAFEPLAIVTYKEKVYCLLLPLDRIDEADENAVFVFEIHKKGGKVDFSIEKDEKISTAVYHKYQKSYTQK